MKAEDFLTKPELAHYSRHLVLPGFGEAGQLRLKKGKVLVVGAGGLGAPLLTYLAAAGVGTIGVIDPDCIEASNLHRQVLYGYDDIGRPKVEVAAQRLQEINPHIEVIAMQNSLTAANALDIIKDYDVVADGTDNFATRYLVNDACVLLGKPNVYASIYRYEGQLSVFNLLRSDGSRGPHYRDLYPQPPAGALIPNCAEGGVLGVLAGIMGSLQTNEVIKILSGSGQPLDGRLLLLDTRDLSTRLVRLPQQSTHQVTELIDYEEFCQTTPVTQMKEVSVKELKTWLEQNKDIQLVDVRTALEHRLGNIGGTLVPLEELDQRYHEIDRHKPVVLYCKVGERSAVALQYLQQTHGFTNLYNLQGGIMAWVQTYGLQE